MEDSWGLRAEEVLSHNFLSLDIGLPVKRLKKPFRALLSGETDLQVVTVEARNRRGREIGCCITCTPLLGKDKAIQGVIATIEEDHQQGKEAGPPA